MNKLEIIYIHPDDIKPYKYNAKLHPREQIEQIKQSIRQFGFNDPIAIDENNTIIEGHGRQIAAKELGIAELPCIVLEGLTEQQKKAYILAHNKLTMNSDFDLAILSDELERITDFDMGDFGFLDAIEHEITEEEHEQNKIEEQFADSNILNLGYRQFPGVGKYDIPEILPETDIPDVTEWVGFNYVLSDKHPEGKGVHFFLNDYQFERIWNRPDEYLEKLSKYAVIAAPDFSPYGDMPLCLQIYNHYRKHWMARYMQDSGLTVIPTIRASTDPRFDEVFLDGEPKGGAVIISSMWTHTPEEKAIFQREYETMFEKLTPNKIFLYGKEENLPGNVIRIPTFADRRFRDG